MEHNCTHPPGQCSSMQREPLVLPAKKKKRNRVATNQLPLNCGSPHRRSYTMWTAEESVRFKHWECDWDEEVGRGSQQTAHDSWQSSSYLQCPSGSSNQWLYSPAEPNQWCTLSRELVGVQISLEWGVLPALETRVSMCRQEAKSLPYPLGRVSSTPSGQKGWQEHLQLCISEMLGLRQAGRTDLPQSKASTRLGGFRCYSQANWVLAWAEGSSRVLQARKPVWEKLAEA